MPITVSPEVEAKAHTTSERLHTRMNHLKQETEAKLKSLLVQATKATGDMKARIDQRIAELHLDGERRSHQLETRAMGTALLAISCTSSLFWIRMDLLLLGFGSGNCNILLVRRRLLLGSIFCSRLRFIDF